MGFGFASGILQRHLRDGGGVIDWFALHGHAVMRDHRGFVDFAPDRGTGSGHASTSAASAGDGSRRLRRGSLRGRLTALGGSLGLKRQEEKRHQ